MLHQKGSIVIGKWIYQNEYIRFGKHDHYFYHCRGCLTKPVPGGYFDKPIGPSMLKA